MATLFDLPVEEQLKALYSLLAAAWSPRGHRELKIIENAVDEIVRLKKELHHCDRFAEETYLDNQRLKGKLTDATTDLRHRDQRLLTDTRQGSLPLD